MTVTYVDSGVLIFAAQGTTAAAALALPFLGDPAREYVTSDYVRLEVLPKCTYHGRVDEIAFYDAFFKMNNRTIPTSQALLDYALDEACNTGISGIDAIHVACAAAKSGLPAEPVRGFRRRWAKVCCAVGLGELVCPDCYPELEEQTIDAKGRCSACGKKWRRQQLKYVGLLFHDLRRSGVRNLIRVGVQQKVAMSISGHKTASVFQRYNIVDERDIMEAGRKLNEKQKSNALLEIPFGQSSGMISTKTGHSDHSEAAPLPALLPN